MNPFDSLSDQQREIVFEKGGKFVVRACPGSGKTYSVAARFARLINEWKSNHQGIAALSFTNVAWQEVENYLQKHFDIYTPIRHPHFLGTIDSFINKYLFLPFGHLIQNCGTRPTLVGAPHGAWSGKNYSESFFDKFSFDINGKNIPLNPRIVPNNSNVKSYIIRARKKYLKLGYANQNDSNYFSLQLLEKFPDLAKSLAVKFPFLIIDEAQDTSEIQMQIIEKLIDNGLEEIMLVGDPDQALYEWNEARPDFLEEKFNNWKENSISLNENRRSSQIVCDFTFNLSTLPQASTAVNKDVKDFNYNPNIVTYDENDIKKTITEFLNNCRGNGIQISQENIAILSRSQSFVNEILGMKNILPKDIPWKPKVSFVKEFALAKYLIDNQQFNKGYKLLERATYKALSDSHYCSQEDLKNLISSYGIIEFRSNIHFLAQILPSTDQVTIKNWIQSSNEVLKKNNIQITLEIKPTKGNIYFDDLFKTAKENKLELNFRLGTVHSVKGETFEAVLLFLKKKGIGSYYKTMLKKGATTSDEEELRIVYVAMTRPRRLLTIAVPDEENLTAWKKRLLSD